MYIKQYTAIHYDVVINSSLVMMEYFAIFLSKNHKIIHKLEIRGKRFLFPTLFLSISITELRCRNPFDIDNRFRFDYFLFLYLQRKTRRLIIETILISLMSFELDFAAILLDEWWQRFAYPVSYCLVIKNGQLSKV